jgi:hypothetical protein
LDEKLKIKVFYEINEIDRLLDAGKPLLDLCKTKELDFIELSAAGLLLQSFYNGIENILKLIIKNYDGKLPNSFKWHMELLENSFSSNDNRKNIFRKDLMATLEDYLKFRHFIRNSYGYRLEWERMEELINDIHNNWEIIKEDINRFFE